MSGSGDVTNPLSLNTLGADTALHKIPRHAQVYAGNGLLLPSSLLTLTGLARNDSGWMVMAEGPDRARCPDCRQVSSSRHSRYVPTLRDLPASGAAVLLRVRVGRWRWRHPGCAVRFFTSGLPGVAELRGRRTSRADVVTQRRRPLWSRTR